MMMAGDIRVRTDKHHRDLYNDFRNFLVKDMHEIFFICVCLGYREGKQKPIGRDADERFWSGTITPEEYASYYAMVIETNDMEFTAIAEDKFVIAEMEKYANAGMQILLESVLADYVIDQEGNPRLDRSVAKELPKVLLAYVFEKSSG